VWKLIDVRRFTSLVYERITTCVSDIGRLAESDIDCLEMAMGDTILPQQPSAER
jgi:hypothetical protein